jgi:hypothetical protein
MPISSADPPSADDVSAALSDINWVYLDEGDDGGVFDYELLSVKPSSNGAYKVLLRVYSAWANVLKTEVNEVKVHPWDFSFEVYFEPAADQWKARDEDILDPTERQPELITQLPNSAARIEKLIQRAFDGWSENELKDIEINKVPKTTKAYLESYVRMRAAGKASDPQ